MKNRKPCMLIILDGWGISPDPLGNAIFLAKTPVLDQLKAAYPHTQLLCAGKAVGLPRGVMGNSEVGHLNIGAGRIVYQDLLRIDKAIADGSFFTNKPLDAILSKVNHTDSAIHLMGLVSDGGVHSQLAHLFALIDMAAQKGIKQVFIHAIMDGRDTPPDSGVRYIRQLQEYIHSKDTVAIATLCGRYYAMDRDNRWDRVEKAFRLYASGVGVPETDPIKAVENAYSRKETDEFICPIVITNAQAEPIGIVRDGDGIIFFNFRADRAREITRAFTDSQFEFFDRNPFPMLCDFLCMTVYDEKFTLPIAFPPIHLNEILGEVISRNGLKQLRIAETEKYAHVTYFFNGGEETPFPNEDRCLVPSPKDVPTYDLKPEMSALAVTEAVIKRIQAQTYDLIVLNFANMDMVGHTGNLDAAIKACETVDTCVGRIVSLIREQGGVVLITADHGNAEKMKEENGHPHTAHTTNPVPFLLVDDTRRASKLRSGILGDIAPTILHIMEIDKPEEMTGQSLIES